jgi:hypothetical protein
LRVPDPAAKLYAEITDYPGLLAAIRARIAELGVSLECVDSIAGISDRYLTKLTCNPPMKYFGAFTLLLVLQALGLKVVLIHDLDAMERIRSRLIRKPLRLGGRTPRQKRRRSRKSVLARRAAKWELIQSAFVEPTV